MLNGAGIVLNAADIVPIEGMSIVAPGGVMVVSPSTTISARYWRIRFPSSQTCPGDVFEAGVAWLGRLVPFGAAPDWTWTDTTTPNVSRSISPYGTARARRVGPPGRAWTMSWGEGASLRALRSAVAADIDGVGVSGGQGIAAAEDAWWVLRGAVETHQALPVVALRSVPADGVTVTDPTLWLYGYLEGSAAARGVVGTEGIDELIRLESITVRGQR